MSTISTPSTSADREFALKQYDTIFRYLAYEGTIYWGRSQHFLVAHAAMLAFFATTRFGAGADSRGSAELAIYLVLCGTGLTLAVLWHKALAAGEFWIEHWRELLIDIEPTAFGDLRVLREFESRSQAKYVSARKVARAAAWLFTIVWVVATLFLVAPLLFSPPPVAIPFPHGH